MNNYEIITACNQLVLCVRFFSRLFPYKYRSLVRPFKLTQLSNYHLILYISNSICLYYIPLYFCKATPLPLAHLQLTSLDMELVSEEAKAFANTVFLKKSMYYNMRSRIVKRHAGHVVRKVKNEPHVMWVPPQI